MVLITKHGDMLVTDISSANVFGLDLSSTSTAGGQAYKKATDILSNKDRYDFNIISTPGVIDEHPPRCNQPNIEYG
jgi:hypothetical protein